MKRSTVIRICLLPWALSAFSIPLLAHGASDVSGEAANKAASLRTEARNLELGNGVPRNADKAILMYCEAARLGDMESQYALGWMYANGHGTTRDDATAAYFFAMAAKQGDPLSQRMLKQVGDPVSKPPGCLFDSDGRDIVESADAMIPNGE